MFLCSRSTISKVVPLYSSFSYSSRLRRAKILALMAPKRKRASLATAAAEADGAPLTTVPIPLPKNGQPASAGCVNPPKEREPVNPNERVDILDAPNALRASPDGEVDEKLVPNEVKQDQDSDSPLSDVPAVLEEKPKRGRKPKAAVEGAPEANTVKKSKAKPKKGRQPAKITNGTPAQTEEESSQKLVASEMADRKEANGAINLEANNEEEADEEEIKEALSRPPPVNSDYLPLPWKGRLGYVSQPSLILFYSCANEY